MREIIFTILSILFAIAGILGGAFVGIYFGIIVPILTICEHVDAGTLTAGVVGMQVIWFFLRGFLSAGCIALGVFLAGICKAIAE